MSANSNREAVFPTRMTLNNTKGRLKGAQTGHSLLKRKADALTKRFRTITAKIDEAKRKMGKVMQLASFSLAEVNYTVGEIGYMVQESVGTKASFTVQARQENVSGVFLPAFEANPNTEGVKGECRTMLRINRQRIEGEGTHRWSGTDLEFTHSFLCRTQNSNSLVCQEVVSRFKRLGKHTRRRYRRWSSWPVYRSVRFDRKNQSAARHVVCSHLSLPLAASRLPL